MASGVVQENGEVTIQFSNTPTVFDIEKDQEYVLIERKGKLYNWSGEVLDLSEIYDIKIKGLVRIKVGFQEKDIENLYFEVTEICVNGDKDKFKGKGYDVYEPRHEEMIDKEIEFESKHIIEIWEKDGEERKEKQLRYNDFRRKCYNFYCDVCKEVIKSTRYHCILCNNDNFDMCQNCFTTQSHEHEITKYEERTLSLIEPNGIKNAGKIISMIQTKLECEILDLKMIRLTKLECEILYKEHFNKKSNEESNDESNDESNQKLITYLTSIPIILMILSGPDIINRHYELLNNPSINDIHSSISLDKAFEDIEIYQSMTNSSTFF